MSNRAPSAAKLASFIRAQRALGIQVPIRELRQRWTERIVPNGWHLQGKAGAEAYLAKYGNNIKLPKLAGLALFAEQERYPEFADRLWARAYELAPKQPQPAPPIQQAISFAGFPNEVWPDQLTHNPGVLLTGNAAKDKAMARKWGIELVKGVPMIVYWAGARLHFQAVSGQQATWHPVLDEAMDCLGRIVGPFALEGVVCFRDGAGQIHSRESEAAAATPPELSPNLVFVVLRAHYYQQTTLRQGSEAARVDAGEDLAAYLQALPPVPSSPANVREVKLELIGWRQHTARL